MTAKKPMGLMAFLVAGLVLMGAAGVPAAGPDKTVLRMENNRAVPPSPVPPGVASPAETSVGVKEIPRPDGGKDKVYFSVTPEADRRAREAAEQYKLEKSLDSLNNIMIFGR